MSKKYTIKLCTIIIVLVAALTLSTKGNTQTNNKLKSKGARIKNPTSQQKQIKKTIKPQRQLSNSAKFSTKIKALEKKLSLTKTELAKAKKNGAKKDGEISKLKSNSTKLSTKIKALEKESLLAKTELAEEKKTGAKKGGEINKLDEKIKFLQDSLDDLDEELDVKVGAYEKYQELINCYRTALFSWDDLNHRQGLTEQDHLLIRDELRGSLFSCPPM